MRHWHREVCQGVCNERAQRHNAVGGSHSHPTPIPATARCSFVSVGDRDDRSLGKWLRRVLRVPVQERREQAAAAWETTTCLACE